MPRDVEWLGHGWEGQNWSSRPGVGTRCTLSTSVLVGTPETAMLPRGPARTHEGCTLLWLWSVIPTPGGFTDIPLP